MQVPAMPRGGTRQRYQSLLDSLREHLEDSWPDSQTEAIQNAPIVLARIAMRNAIADPSLRTVSDDTNLRAA